MLMMVIVRFQKKYEKGSRRWSKDWNALVRMLYLARPKGALNKHQAFDVSKFSYDGRE